MQRLGLGVVASGAGCRPSASPAGRGRLRAATTAASPRGWRRWRRRSGFHEELGVEARAALRPQEVDVVLAVGAHAAVREAWLQDVGAVTWGVHEALVDGDR